MESTLFTTLSTREEANLSGGQLVGDINTAVALNVAALNGGDVAQNATAIANSGNRNRFRIRNRARA